MKPRLFIASSSESLGIANAIHANLQHHAEVTVWNQAILALSSTTLQSLLAELPSFDFGAFVFSPDDLSTIRGQEHTAVRDNVIFELGLFIGFLGQDRCFIVTPQETGELRFPTDLLGVAPARYETARSDKNLVAATSPASEAIRKHIEAKGTRLRAGGQAEGTAAPLTSTSKEPSDSKVETPASQAIAVAAAGEPKLEPWLDAYVHNRPEEALEILSAEIK